MKTCNSGSDVVGLVLDRTPLYAEQGGQTFDKARRGGVEQELAGSVSLSLALSACSYFAAHLPRLRSLVAVSSSA